jgi:F-type H+-transporting ATPase subunit delta
MTMENRIARPYAKAAFAVASEQQQVAEWSTALQLLSAAVAQPVVQAWLKDPKTTQAQVLEWLVGLKPECFGESLKRFIVLLSDRDRLEVAGGISTLFERYRAKAASYTQVKLSVAQAAEPAQVEKIKQALTTRLGMDVQIETETDSSLIGGGVVKAGDVLIDGSVLGQLKRVADALEVV